MMIDQESTTKELQKMLSEHGNHICEGEMSPKLEWTHCCSAYCQMTHYGNKGKRLAWARENKGDDFSDCIYSDETTVQIDPIDDSAAPSQALNQGTNQD